jgi:UDP-glucose 4-epimerase
VDGTGVRDYIHISDLVSGHMAALEYFSHHSHTPKAGFFEIFNL